MERWRRGPNYLGQTYYDYFVLVSRHRDSSCLARANFEAALKELDGEGDGVLIARASHWAVGWVEHLLIHQDAEEKVAIGEDIDKRLEIYPILDEELLSTMEDDEAALAWEVLPMGERVALCKKHHVSIFAARHDWVPGCGIVQELAR